MEILVQKFQYTIIYTYSAAIFFLYMKNLMVGTRLKILNCNKNWQYNINKWDKWAEYVRKTKNKIKWEYNIYTKF